MKQESNGRGAQPGAATGRNGAAEAQYEVLPLDWIEPSKTNPRKYFDEEALKELAANIGRVGILQPLVVRPKEGAATSRGGATPNGPFELVAGERRWRAARMAGLQTLPVMVRELSDVEVVELQCIENLQRSDLSAIEEAQGFQQLIALGKYTPEALAEKLDRSRAHVFGRLRLLKLSAPVRAKVVEGKLNASVAGLLAALPDPKKQVEAMAEVGGIACGGWGSASSFREAKGELERKYMTALRGCPFRLDDATLDAKAGPCATCPKRAGNMALFGDLGGDPNVCTDPACFERKLAAAWARKVKEREAAGLKCVEGAALARGGYVKLDDKCWRDAEERTYRQILKGQVTPALARDGHRFVEVVPEAALKQALPQPKASSYEVYQKKRTAARKALRPAAAALRAKVIQKASTGTADLKWFKQLMEVLVAEREFDAFAELRASRLLEVDPRVFGHATVQCYVRNGPWKPSLENAQGLLLDLVLRENVDAFRAELGNGLRTACEVFGVDWKGALKAAAKESKGKTKGKTKGKKR